MPESPDAGIVVKKKMLDDLAKQSEALKTRQPADPVSKPVEADKIHPKSQYGDRPGEKRIDVKDMVKPLGSFKNGTDRVPKTGPYILHEDEAVLTKEENQARKMDPYKLVNEDKKPPKKLHEIRTRKSTDGKHYIHEHHFTEPAHHKMEEHVSTSSDHVKSHMPLDEESGETPGQEQQEQALGFEPQD
ncbi:MAG: hypothetical protein C5B59_08735 [Bacteroidetes bacterium]|nr:MAG: hypothetical protein C5B59_08735 [Bacteroidota bacterium]